MSKKVKHKKTDRNDNHKNTERQDNVEQKEKEQVQEQETAVDESGKQQDDEMRKLKEELQKEKERYLRLFAEFENYKKRTSKERIELFSTANKELMEALLPVLDDFERGLAEIEKSDDNGFIEGMKLIFNKFKNTLVQKGLKDIEVKKGDEFNPDIHDAITQIPAPEEDLKGKIIDVVEKGYMLGDTIIRYPKVVTGR